MVRRCSITCPWAILSRISRVGIEAERRYSPDCRRAPNPRTRAATTKASGERISPASSRSAAISRSAAPGGMTTTCAGTSRAAGRSAEAATTKAPARTRAPSVMTKTTRRTLQASLLLSHALVVLFLFLVLLVLVGLVVIGELDLVVLLEILQRRRHAGELLVVLHGGQRLVVLHAKDHRFLPPALRRLENGVAALRYFDNVNDVEIVLVPLVIHQADSLAMLRHGAPPAEDAATIAVGAPRRVQCTIFSPRFTRNAPAPGRGSPAGAARRPRRRARRAAGRGARRRPAAPAPPPRWSTARRRAERPPRPPGAGGR